MCMHTPKRMCAHHMHSLSLCAVGLFVCFSENWSNNITASTSDHSPTFLIYIVKYQKLLVNANPDNFQTCKQAVKFTSTTHFYLYITYIMIPLICVLQWKLSDDLDNVQTHQPNTQHCFFCPSWCPVCHCHYPGLCVLPRE